MGIASRSLLKQAKTLGITQELASFIVKNADIYDKRLVYLAALKLKHNTREDYGGTIKLTPTQQAFYESPVRYRLISAPNRGGKTAVCAYLIASCARRKHPVWSAPPSVNGLYCIFAPRRDQLTDPWLKKLCEASEFKGPHENLPLIPREEIQRIYFTHGAGQPTPKYILLRNGNAIWFSVSGDKRSWEGLEGKGMVLGICIDENAGTQQLIDECMARLLDAHSHPELRKYCPGGFLVWGATETKVNPAFSSFREKCNDPNYPDFAEFKIAPNENPAIDFQERLRLQGAISDEMYNTRMLSDDGALQTARVFPQFDPEIHCSPKPYEPSDNDCIFVGWDPGVNYAGHVYAAINPEEPRTLHVFCAREIRRATLAAEAQLIQSIVRGRAIEWLAYDQAARKVEKSSGTCLLWQFLRELKNAGVKLNKGAKKGRSNYQDSVPVVRAMLSERRIILHKGTEVLRHQFLSFRFTSLSQELKADNIQRGDDHCLDALRYLATTGPTWRPAPPNPPTLAPTEFNADDSALKQSENELIASQYRICELYLKGELPGWEWTDAEVAYNP